MDAYAAEKGFDPLVPENWYNIRGYDIVEAQVPLHLISALLYLSSSSWVNKIFWAYLVFFFINISHRVGLCGPFITSQFPNWFAACTLI